MPSAHQVIGTNLLRKEGLEKVTGRALYADDLPFPGALHGVTIRSTGAHGRVKSIRFLDGIPWNEFTIVLPKDIPGENAVTLIDKTQVFLATEYLHPAEPLALLAHPDRAMAHRALGFVAVDVEPLPAIFTIEEAEKQGDAAVYKSFRIQDGDVARGLAEADLVLEETYRTPTQEQLYIEPQGIIAQHHADGPVDGARITVWGSMQCPYYIQRALAPLFVLPAGEIRVIQSETGGGFGGKEEYPNVLAGHAALLSWKSGGRAVKMIYDRDEDLLATPKRHPARTRVKAGFKKDGTITALEIDFVLDGGAYFTLSQTVLSRGILHSFGPYRIPHADLRARVLKTNNLPSGAFRGFGAPQTVFAMECHLNLAAHRLGIDPAEMRRRNFLRKGDKMPTGQIVTEEIDLPRLLDHALGMAEWKKRRAAYEIENRSKSGLRKGIGLCFFFHGSGFTGSGEVMLGSRAAARLTSEGGIEVLAANVEYGQGTNTTFTQIAAQTARIPPDRILVHRPDTGIVPNSGPTVASRTTMIVGRLVERAVTALRDRVAREAGLGPDYKPEEFLCAAAAIYKKEGAVTETVTYEPPKDVFWDDKAYRGEAYAAYSWCCDIADMEYDPITYQAEVKRFVSVVECGRVLNPILAAGQIEGGVAQGIGWALYEDVVMKEGQMKNTQFTNYIIPTTADIPDIRVEFIEFPFSNAGPFQAKGIGELPADGPAPAMAGALAQALGGVFLSEIPLLPERIMKAVRA